PTQVDHRWQDLTGAAETAIQLLVRKDPAFDTMDNSIDARARIADEKVHRGERLALRREGDLDRIIYAARAEHLHVGSVGTDAKDPRRLSLEDPAFLASDGKRALAVGPVDAAIGTEKRAVDVAAIAAEIEPGDELLAPRGPSLAIGFFQTPQTGRGGRVQRPIVPQDAHRKGHLVREDPA